MVDQYEKLGCSSSKEEVHEAISYFEKGLLPGSFCQIFPDFDGDPDDYIVMHADTAGTKASLAYLMWKETGEEKYLENVAHDAIVMNLDDLLCVGITDNIYFSNIISRNKKRIPAEALKAIFRGIDKYLSFLQDDLKVNVSLTGGETADVGDLIKTFDVAVTVFSKTKKNKIVDNDNIRPGDVIIGLASEGTCEYDKTFNSGIGSNGLTLARHKLTHHSFTDKYPETYDNALSKAFVYTNFSEKDMKSLDSLTHPTRTYLPVVRAILEIFGSSKIHGMVHCTGGGQTKCRKFGQGIHYVKDNLFLPNEIFNKIQSMGEPIIETKEMYKVFNMGHRFEIYVEPQYAEEIINVSKHFGIDAKIVGRCEKSYKNDGENHLTIKNPSDILYF